MVIKQIIFDEQSGKLFLSDDKNNHYLCNIYGQKKTSFLPDITGIYNAPQRKNINNNDIDDPLYQDIYPQNKSQMYLPTTRRFEGYVPFSKPLAPVFDNIDLSQITSPMGIGTNNSHSAKYYQDKLIKQLKKHFTNEKSQKMFNKSENKGLSYLSHSVVKYSKSDRDNLIQLIDRHFEEYKQINKYKLNVMHKDPEVKALKRLKLFLQANEDTNIINGRELNPPSEEIVKKYSKVKKAMMKERHEKNEEQLFSDNMKAMKNNVKTMKSNLYSPSPSNKNLKIDNHVRDDMSFLSVETENERRYKNQNLSKSVKSLKSLQIGLENEKKFIDGFKEKPVKEEGIIRKNGKSMLKSPGELYMKNMKLLEKVNPVAFENIRKKDEYDMKELVKKRGQKVIFQKNFG